MRTTMTYLAGSLLVSLVCVASGCSSGTVSHSNPAAVSGAGGLPGSGAAGTASGGGAAGLDMFAAWELARSDLRKSPDHLPARADALVQGKDPAAIFQFVRDEIATYPPSNTGFDGAVSARRWGARGTLRGGAGTPREKAELLVLLYEKAGFTAEVVQGVPDPAKADGRQVLLRQTEHAFQSTLSEAEAQSIGSALGNTSTGVRAVIDPDGLHQAELADALLALLPGDLGSVFDFALPAIPLVRVKIGSEWKYANPIVPAAPFGDPATVGSPTPAGSASSLQKVHVLLEAARAVAPYDRFKVVERTYDAEDVVARRIQLAFAPPVALKSLVGMRVQDVETLVPVLSVVGRDLSEADTQRLAVVGNMMSLGGDVFEQTASGLAANGLPLAPVTTDPVSVAKVANVSAHASGTTFPRVRVTVSALDQQGTNVSSLGAGAFELLEDGKPVSFSVTQNRAPAPRLVLLFDASTSVPDEFRGASAVAMGNQIVDALYAAHADAQLRVATINMGAIFETSTWATTPEQAKSQVLGLQSASGSSEIWQALYEVDRKQPTVVVLVTDGSATDTEEPQFRNAIASGCPVLSIGVGPVDVATLDRVSELSGGRSVLASNQQQAIDAILAEIAARSAEDYVLSYRAPPGSGSTRTVTVTVNGKSSEVRYDVPAAPAIPNALSGFYLTLGVNGRNESLPLAGFSLSFSAAPNITQAMLDDARSLMFGRVSISVEGAAPSAAVVLDDWISEKLALRPFWEAAVSGDSATILAALSSGISLTPEKLPLSQAPLRDAASATALTFETGPRISTLIQKVRDGGPVSRQLDLFPLSEWATATDNPRAAWEHTLRATAGLAVMEAELFDGTSTLEALAGIKLTRVDAGQARNQAGLSDEEKRAWISLEAPFNGEYQLLVPLKPGPFWAVHEGTGTVIGLLPDGTGGGAEEVCGIYSMANAYLQYMGLLGSLFGVPLGGWGALAQWEVKNVTMATLVIGYGAAAQDISNPALAVGCSMLSSSIGGRIPAYASYSRIVSTLNTTGVDHSAPSLCSGGAAICK